MLGSDFEAFLTLHDRIIPETVLKLPDKQETPIPLSDEFGSAGFIHRDNVMVEMCCVPASSAEELVSNVQRSLAAGRALLQSKDDCFGLSNEPFHTFNQCDLDTPEGGELGCDNDFVSHEGNSVQRDPLTREDLGYSRFCGGHIHISYKLTEIPVWIAAMLCDLFIGIPSIPYLNGPRSTYYGDLSLHRPTRYPDGSTGVEYRPLDNFWVHNTGKCLNVAQGASKVQNLLDKGNYDVIHELMGVHANLPKPCTTLIDLRGVGVAGSCTADAQEIYRRATK